MVLVRGRRSIQNNLQCCPFIRTLQRASVMHQFCCTPVSWTPPLSAPELPCYLCYMYQDRVHCKDCCVAHQSFLHQYCATLLCTSLLCSALLHCCLACALVYKMQVRGGTSCSSRWPSTVLLRQLPQIFLLRWPTYFLGCHVDVSN